MMMMDGFSSLARKGGIQLKSVALYARRGWDRKTQAVRIRLQKRALFANDLYLIDMETPVLICSVRAADHGLHVVHVFLERSRSFSAIEDRGI